MKTTYISLLIILSLILIVWFAQQPGKLTSLTSQLVKQEPTSQITENNKQVKITLSTDSISASSETVSIVNRTATITSGGSYNISGELQNGQIIINAPDKDVEIILDNVTITNNSGPAIYVVESKDTSIMLAKNSTNSLADGSNYGTFSLGEDFAQSTIYSMSDLHIIGNENATLTVAGNYNDAITSKDDLNISKASITLSAEDDGMRGKDSVNIVDSTISIIAQGDGIKSDNQDDEKAIISLENSQLTISAGDDAIHAYNSVEILSGTIDILNSYEGIESKVITIYAGNISVISQDDALNVTDATSQNNLFDRLQGNRGGGMHEVFEDGQLNIYGGTITLNSEGDGFDSNGNAVMTGGTLIVNGPTNDGNGAIDVNGQFNVSGGTIIALGSSGMAETPSETSTQNTIKVNFDEVMPDNTNLALLDSNNEEVFSYTTAKQFQSVVYSSEKLLTGHKYTLMLNGSKHIDLTLNEVITIHGQASRRGGPRGDRGARNFE